MLPSRLVPFCAVSVDPLSASVVRAKPSGPHGYDVRGLAPDKLYDCRPVNDAMSQSMTALSAGID